MKYQFQNEEHENRFYTMLGTDQTETNDRERISMFYIISGNYELYEHVYEIYNFHTHHLRSDPIHKLGYMCSSSRTLLKLSLHLYNSNGIRNLAPCEILGNLDHANLDLALNGMRLRFQ